MAEVYADASSHRPETGSAKGPAPSRGNAATADADNGTGRLYAATVAAPAASKRGLAPGSAVLSTPRVLRVMLTPWKDDEGDLQTGGFVYLRLDNGQWALSP